LGVGKFFTALNFDGSSDIPFSKMMCLFNVKIRIYLFVILNYVCVVAVPLLSAVCYPPVGLIRI